MTSPRVVGALLVGAVLGGAAVWVASNAWYLYSLVMIPFNGHRKVRRWWM